MKSEKSYQIIIVVLFALGVINAGIFHATTYLHPNCGLPLMDPHLDPYALHMGAVTGFFWAIGGSILIARICILTGLHKKLGLSEK